MELRTVSASVRFSVPKSQTKSRLYRKSLICLILTIDAMETQVKIAEKIIDKLIRKHWTVENNLH
jgi:hypothetical protein